MPGLPSLQQAGSVIQNQPCKQQSQSEKTKEEANQVPNPLCCGHGDAIHLEEACSCRQASRHRLHTCITSLASHMHCVTGFTYASRHWLHTCFHVVAQQTSKHQLPHNRILILDGYQDQRCHLLQHCIQTSSTTTCGTRAAPAYTQACVLVSAIHVLSVLKASPKCI